MDWAESDELMQIYLGEVDERSESLISGARALTDGSLDPSRVDDLVRDAHTLKGSSYMVGKPDVAEAALALEKAWKHVNNTNATYDADLGVLMAEVAVLLKAAARESGTPGLGESAKQLNSKLDDDSSSEPPPGDRGTSESDISVAELLSQPERVDSSAGPAVKDDFLPSDGETLGGLLPSLEADLEGSVMRVDTGALYTLINRVVEIGIELESLDDLALVSFDSERSGMLLGWRDQIARVSGELGDLQRAAVSLVNVPLHEAVETFPQFVRFLGRRLEKPVRFETEGVDVQVDRQIVDLLREPLRHLIVNAVDHGLEKEADRVAAGKEPVGVVRLKAAVEDDRLILAVSDDGRGIDWESVRARAVEKGLPSSTSELRSHLLRPGFTTADVVMDFSGTGEGLAILADAVDKVSGSVMIHSTDTGGTTVMMDVPVSLVLQRIVSVSAGDQVFGVSEAAIIDAVDTLDQIVDSGHGHRELLFENERIPFVSVAEATGVGGGADNLALVLSSRSGLVAAGIGAILGDRSVAVKNVGAILDDADYIAGAAFLGGGTVLVVVDHNHLGAIARSTTDAVQDRQAVLVVDDSAGVRQLIAATLRGNGFEVELAANGAEALQLLESRRFDALVVDYSMPGSNGADLVRTARQSGVTLPIVMVSGVAEPEDKAAAWESGVDAYLDKYDLRRGALTESIRRLLSERSSPHV